MAKNTFLDWDQTASNNTDVGGIGIQGTNAVSNFDDALRTIMAQLRAGVDGEVAYITKSANYTAVANDNNAFLRFTAASTLSLTAAATLGPNWHIKVVADGGDVIIDPNASETIDGATTITVKNGYTAVIICNGTAFFSDKISSTLTTALSNLAMPGHIFGLTLSNNSVDAVNDIDIAAGSAASDASTPVFMTLAAGITKRLDAAWAVGSGNGGLDTGAIANTTYYMWLIQRSDTGVTDVCFSASGSSPTFGGNIPVAYDRKRYIGSVTRAGGTILAFRQNGPRFMLTTLVQLYSNTGVVNVSNQLVAAIGPAARRFRPILTSTLATAASSSIVIALGDGDGAAIQSNIQFVTGSASDIAIEDSFLTNTTGQVRHSVTTSAGSITTYSLSSIGWWDDRGTV